MEARRTRSRQVVEIEEGRGPQRVERRLEVAGAGQQRRVDGRRQRTAVGGTPLVEAEIRLEAAGHHLVGHEVVEHQDVGLLDHLGAVGPIRAEQQIGGDGATGRHLGDDQRLEAVEAGELLVHAGVAVVAVVEPVGQLPPAAPLGRGDAVGGSVEELGRPSEVPTGEHVGAGVVVDRLVVLVGADDAVDVAGAVGLDPDPGRPVPGRLHQEAAERALARTSWSPDHST